MSLLTMNLKWFEVDNLRSNTYMVQSWEILFFLLCWTQNWQAGPLQKGTGHVGDPIRKESDGDQPGCPLNMEAGSCSQAHLVFGAKAGDMDHQTLLWAHYSLQKGKIFPRWGEEIKKDDSDFKILPMESILFSSKQMVLSQAETLIHFD